MIFEEIYSAYYNAVAQIISAIISGNTDEKNLIEIVYRSAFSESVLSVLPALKKNPFLWFFLPFFLLSEFFLMVKIIRNSSFGSPQP